ncbi:unnamed protein product [Ophioblennius macclurei]
MVLGMLLIALLMFGVHSQGIPDENSLNVTTLTDEPVTSSLPIITPREDKGLCNCRGKESEIVHTPCRCEPSVRRKGRRGKSKRRCQLKKYKNLKKCRRTPPPFPPGVVPI